jgi:hypothetical protein
MEECPFGATATPKIDTIIGPVNHTRLEPVSISRIQSIQNCNFSIPSPSLPVRW